MNKNAKLWALTLSFVLMGLTCACTLEDKSESHLATFQKEKARVAADRAEDFDEANDYEEAYEADEDEENGEAIEEERAFYQSSRSHNVGKSRKNSLANQKSQPPSLAPRGFGQYQIYDQQARMPVATLQVPRGWQATSQVKWGQFGYSLCIYEALFSDPNSGVAVSFSSGLACPRNGSNRNSELLNNPRKYGDLFIGDIKKYAHLNGPVKLVSADLVSPSASTKQFATQLQSQGGSCLAKQLVVKYDFQKNNQPWGAMLTVDVILQEVSFAYGPTNHTEWLLNLASYVYPKSNAESVIKLGKQIIASGIPNPQWQQYLANVTTGTVSQQNSQFQSQQQAVRQNQQDISDMLSDSYQQRSASQDRVSQGWSEAIRGESSHSNPYDSSSTVTTSNSYNHGWANSNGDVINTDSSNFNPNTASDYNGTEWTQIK